VIVPGRLDGTVFKTSLILHAVLQTVVIVMCLSPELNCSYTHGDYISGTRSISRGGDQCLLGDSITEVK